MQVGWPNVAPRTAWRRCDGRIQSHVVSSVWKPGVFAGPEGACEPRAYAFGFLHAEADQRRGLFRLLVHVRRARFSRELR